MSYTKIITFEQGPAGNMHGHIQALAEFLDMTQFSIGVLLVDAAGTVVYSNGSARRFFQYVPGISKISLSEKFAAVLQGADLITERVLTDRVQFSFTEGAFQDRVGNEVCTTVKKYVGDKVQYHLSVNDTEVLVVDAAPERQLYEYERNNPRPAIRQLTDCFLRQIEYLSKSKMYTVQTRWEAEDGSRLIILTDDERIDAEKRRLIGDLCHRLENPVAEVKLALAPLKSHNDSTLHDPTVSAVLEDVSGVLGVLSGTIRGLNRIRSIKTIVLERISVQEFFRSYLEQARMLYKDISFEVKYAGGKDIEDVQVQVDKGHLQDGLDRLLENSVQAIHDRNELALKKGLKPVAGMIEFVWSEVTLGGRRLRLEVRDNGIGMAKENLPMILREAKSMREPGLSKRVSSGIGTNLARDYLVNYNTGIDLHYDSEGLNKGMTVSVEFNGKVVRKNTYTQAKDKHKKRT